PQAIVGDAIRVIPQYVKDKLASDSLKVTKGKLNEPSLWERAQTLANISMRVCNIFADELFRNIGGKRGGKSSDNRICNTTIHTLNEVIEKLLPILPTSKEAESGHHISPTTLLELLLPAYYYRVKEQRFPATQRKLINNEDGEETHEPLTAEAIREVVETLGEWDISFDARSK
ncbi:hypothetical protein CYMTET_19697, partial [Cymbomonas tetramitiformis]